MKSGDTSCRILGCDKVLTLRATSLLDVIPGRIITVQPERFWVNAGRSLAILHDLLWLNPLGHQGARHMLGPVAARRFWDDCQEEED